MAKFSNVDLYLSAILILFAVVEQFLNLTKTYNNPNFSTLQKPIAFIFKYKCVLCMHL